MNSYSFQDVVCAISGPGGAFPLAPGGGVAEEGITIAEAQDRVNSEWGADGRVVHSAIAASGSEVTIRLLKTSEANALLQVMYNLQTSTPRLTGRNTITVANTHSGDLTVLQEAAFVKAPDLQYAKDAGAHEWVFRAGRTTRILGAGVEIDG